MPSFLWEWDTAGWTSTTQWLWTRSTVFLEFKCPGLPNGELFTNTQKIGQENAVLERLRVVALFGKICSSMKGCANSSILKQLFLFQLYVFSLLFHIWTTLFLCPQMPGEGIGSLRARVTGKLCANLCRFWKLKLNALNHGAMASSPDRPFLN